jgi:hypothetical protein
MTEAAQYEGGRGPPTWYEGHFAGRDRRWASIAAAEAVRWGIRRRPWPTLCNRAGVFTARFILFGIALAQLADAFTFTIGVSQFGIGLESNGIAAALYHLGGLDAVLLAKGAVLVTTITVLAYAANRYRRLLVWGGATATSLGLLGFAANTASLMLLS